MIKLIRHGLILLLAGAVLSGCFNTDNPPQLEIIVLDQQKQPVSGAFVGIFDNLDDWLSRENPVQVWKQTGYDGRVLFTDLDEKIYYIYVRSNLRDNSNYEISTTTELEINQKAIIRIHID